MNDSDLPKWKKLQLEEQRRVAALREAEAKAKSEKLASLSIAGSATSTAPSDVKAKTAESTKGTETQYTELHDSQTPSVPDDVDEKAQPLSHSAYSVYQGGDAAAKYAAALSDSPYEDPEIITPASSLARA
jgi:hypothetical protein